MSRNVFFFFVLVKYVSKSLGFIVLVKRKEWTGSRLQHSGPQTLNPFVKDQDQTNDKKYVNDMSLQHHTKLLFRTNKPGSKYCNRGAKGSDKKREDMRSKSHQSHRSDKRRIQKAQSHWTPFLRLSFPKYIPKIQF